jgi:uncharacterized RmlC-like cupin family protein
VKARVSELNVTATTRVQVVAPGKNYVGNVGHYLWCGCLSREGRCALRLHVRAADTARHRSQTHYHKGIETIAHLLEGQCVVQYGAQLEDRVAKRR